MNLYFSVYPLTAGYIVGWASLPGVTPIPVAHTTTGNDPIHVDTALTLRTPRGNQALFSSIFNVARDNGVNALTLHMYGCPRNRTAGCTSPNGSPVFESGVINGLAADLGPNYSATGPVHAMLRGIYVGDFPVNGSRPDGLSDVLFVLDNGAAILFQQQRTAAPSR